MSEADRNFNVKLNFDMREATADLVKYSVALYGVLGILNRLGLPEEAQDCIRVLQKMIATINMLRASMIALQIASGPLGWALAGVSVAGSVLTLADVS